MSVTTDFLETNVLDGSEHFDDCVTSRYTRQKQNTDNTDSMDDHGFSQVYFKSH